MSKNKKIIQTPKIKFAFSSYIPFSQSRSPIALIRLEPQLTRDFKIVVTPMGLWGGWRYFWILNFYAFLCASLTVSRLGQISKPSHNWLNSTSVTWDALISFIVLFLALRWSRLHRRAAFRPNKTRQLLASPVDLARENGKGCEKNVKEGADGYFRLYCEQKPERYVTVCRKWRRDISVGKYLKPTPGWKTTPFAGTGTGGGCIGCGGVKKRRKGLISRPGYDPE